MDTAIMMQASERNLPATDFSNFEEYLDVLGLPTENIVANPEERMRIMNAIPEFVQSINPEIKREARYLSKFIAGSAVGLFDASLNYIWNEVIVNLRNKIVLYGLDLFFDAAVGERYREEYKSEKDLEGIKDRTLLDICRKLELISDLVYKKLSHILTMRNDIGASHPNTDSINSFELLGWLQTCIDDVIEVKPSAAALNNKAIIDNLKVNQNPIDDEVISQFRNSIKETSNAMAGNLLISLFGIFADSHTERIVQENILRLAPTVWEYSTDNIKYDLGEKVDSYRGNLNLERAELAERFFQVCEGNRYLSLNSRDIKLSNLCDELMDAHNGRDNYYHEPPVIRKIMTYINKSEDIPKEREEKIIKTILMCRIGREVQYQGGVSPGARPLYDKFFELLDSSQIILLLSLLEDYEISNKLRGNVRSYNVKTILLLIRTSLNSPRVNEIIDFLLDNVTILHKIDKDKRYRDLTKGLLR